MRLHKRYDPIVLYHKVCYQWYPRKSFSRKGIKGHEKFFDTLWLFQGMCWILERLIQTGWEINTSCLTVVNTGYDASSYFLKKNSAPGIWILCRNFDLPSPTMSGFFSVMKKRKLFCWWRIKIGVALQPLAKLRKKFELSKFLWLN